MNSAIAIEQKLLAVDNKDERSFIDLARTLREFKKDQEAISVLQSGTEIVPDSDAIKLELAKIYLDKYDQKPALEILAKMEKQDSAGYYNAIGVASDLDGNPVAAQGYYDKGLKIAPGDQNLRNNLAVSLLMNNQVDRGVLMLENLTRSSSLSPKYRSRYRQNLALGYGLQGRGDKARDLLGKDLPPAKVQENLGFYREISSSNEKIEKAPAPKVEAKKELKPVEKKETKPAEKKAEKKPEKKPEKKAEPKPAKVAKTEEITPVKTPEVKVQDINEPKKSGSYVSGSNKSTSTKAFLGQ